MAVNRNVPLEGGGHVPLLCESCICFNLSLVSRKYHFDGS